MTHPAFTIGEVARRCGYSIETIRELERRGVVQPLRTTARLRLFSPDDLTAIENYRAGTAARDAAARQKAREAARRKKAPRK